MNKIKLFKNLVLLLAFFLSASSCKNWSNQPAQIRITDLSGKPANVEVRTPEGNAQILEDLQNNKNSYQEPSQAAKTAPVIVTQDQPKDVPVNKYVRMENDKTPNNPPLQNINAQIPQIATAKQDIKQKNQNNKLELSQENQSKETAMLEDQAQATKQELIKQEQNTAKAINSASINATANTNLPTTAAAKPQNIAPEKIFVFKPTTDSSALPTPAKSTTKSGEIYVQLGLFAQMDNAKKALESSQNISAGEVKEENISGKNSYRALLGPFASNSQAQEIIRQLSKSGKDSFIYKK